MMMGVIFVSLYVSMMKFLENQVFFFFFFFLGCCFLLLFFKCIKEYLRCIKE